MVRSTEGPAAEVDEVATPEGPDAVDPPQPSLDGLSIAGITRRRAAFLIGAFVTLWIVVAFARQVGEASEASARADAMRARNAELAGEVAALNRELELIQRQEFILQQARGHGLGRGREIPFRLDADAGPLPADAPGSAAARLGSAGTRRSPLDSWLSLLFGPAD